MALALVIDDTSLVLLLVFVAALSVSIYISRSYQPLIHPLILSRQADVSQVRLPKESAIYRNANSPSGFDLALRPRKQINDVSDLVKVGATGSEVNTKRSLYGVGRTNEDLAGDATAFATGFIKLSSAPVLQTTFAVLSERDSYESLVALLANSHTSVSSRFHTVVLPTSDLNQQFPTSLPSSLSSAGARSVIGLFTTAQSISTAFRLAFLDQSALIIVPTADLEEAKRRANDHFGGSHRTRIYSFDQVLEAGSRGSLLGTAATSKDSLQQVQSHYWNGRAAAWLAVQHANLIAGVTAQLALFPADQIPTTSDRLFVEAASHADTPASLLMATRSPAGFVLALLAVYTGSSIVADLLTSSYDDPNPAPSSALAESNATLVYASAEGASSLACALTSITRRSAIASLAARNKLYSLRNGTFGKQGIIDRLVYRQARESTGTQKVRNLLILGAGATVPQGLLDSLRAHLGCSVLNGYLPRSMIMAATAPISATHTFDLQAFAQHEHGGMQVPAHVGPPSVSVEIKLVQTQSAAEKGFTIAGTKPDGYQGDPMGEIMVRGPIVSASNDTTAADTDAWISTGDFAAFRSNGTLVVLRDAGESDPVPVPTLSHRKPVIRQRRTAGKGAGRLASSVAMVATATLALLTVASTPLASAGTLSKRASINSTMTDLARTGMMTGQRAAWEQGVGQSALLELDFPGYSVFSSTGGGPPFRPGHERAPGSPPYEVLSMAYHSASRQDNIGRLAFRITADEVPGAGSSLDGVSTGAEVLLTAWMAGEIDQKTGEQGSGFYIDAAKRALDLATVRTPRSRSGAISHRYQTVQLWSDAVYMMPPFIAWYGMITRNQTLLQLSYDQIRLYRDSMQLTTGNAAGLWGHIVFPNNNTWVDGGAWCTGNGWAAAGMLRVLATIEQSESSLDMVNQKNDLVSWINEILDASYPLLDDRALLWHNYMNDTSDFFDTAGTALLTYATYRMASMVKGNDKWISQADSIHRSLATALDPIGQFRAGYPVTDVLGFTQQGETSSESLSFMMLMSAARRDYQNGDVVRVSTPESAANAATPSHLPSSLSLPVLAASALLTVLVSTTLI